jgi:hypothetical protein
MTTLKFNEKSHRYWLDGKPIPGVTTLLNKGVPKPQLTYWSARTVAEFVADNPDEVEALRRMGRGPMVAALKDVPWQARDEAAVRGTDVHRLAEDVIHGQEVEVPAELAGYVDGYVRWLDLFNVEPILTERRIINRKWWYAGTFDAIVRIGGETLLVDLKTAKAIYGEVAAQVAAYANAECYLDDDGNEVPLPHIDGIAAVHVTDVGTQMFRFRDPDAAWKFFQHAAWLGRQMDALKEQVGDPEQPPTTLTVVA